jgi:hypothetical protein
MAGADRFSLSLLPGRFFFVVVVVLLIAFSQCMVRPISKDTGKIWQRDGGLLL